MIQWKENRKESMRECREDGTYYYPYHNVIEVLSVHATLIAGVTTLIMAFV